jgi:polysaccharide export outer membrane protein
MSYKITRCKPSFYLFLSLTLILFASGCSDIKKATYFNDLNDQKLVAANTLPDPVIQQNDLLSITVSSLNPQASALFNAPNESTPQTNQATSYGNNTLTVGYLVSLNGDIQFPVLGTIHVEGLTKTQLNQLLVKQLTDRKLLVDPIVTIRFLNYRVSVLGEVARPGIYTSPSEKLTIMEALGLAGDMTIYGKKDNVLIIREVSPGEKTIARLNLNSKSVLTSPYYYLKSNDVIYVEPIKDKLARERNQYILPIIFSLTTLVLVVVDRFN